MTAFALTFQGNPVKSSRLFAGYEHEHQAKNLAAFFNKPLDYYSRVDLDKNMISKLEAANEKTGEEVQESVPMMQQSLFAKRSLATYSSYEEAYHQLILDLVKQQAEAIRLVMKGPEIKKIFVDGGFSRSPIYMHLIARSFPGIKVYATSMAQATAVGAAVAIHEYWNDQPLPEDIIELNYYPNVTADTKLKTSDLID